MGLGNAIKSDGSAAFPYPSVVLYQSDGLGVSRRREPLALLRRRALVPASVDGNGYGNRGGTFAYENEAIAGSLARVIMVKIRRREIR